MTRIRVSLSGGDALQQGDASLLEAWQRGSGARIWTDIEDPTEALLEELLERRFGFHELAAEDSLSPNTLPKYDAFPGYDFFVFRAVDVELREHRTQTLKLAAFLGPDFLFTVHAGALPAIDDAFSRLPNDLRMLNNGPDYLLYEIVDVMVDAHFPLLEKIEECVDALHEEIFRSSQPAQLDELLHLKRDVNALRRHSLPQRELLNLMSRGDSPVIQKQHLIYFRDLYDHMFRISETIDSERDMISGTMEAYLSVIANRTNEIMRVLTVLSTIMLPLTLIAGIYGMNFEHMPELHWLHGYPFALGLMAATVLIMLAFFWRKGWIGKTPSS